MLKFAILGCGRIAYKHCDVLGEGKIKNAKLVAVCDLKQERAEKFGKQYGVPFFTDLRTMMQNMGSQIDVVNILTPSGNHAKHTLEVASYKKHVVVEKPMALTLEDADSMISTCEKNGVRLFVVKQNRYNLPVQKLREAITSNRFGKLVLGTVRVRWCRQQDYYNQDSWRGTWALDGGVFSNQASHHIDLLEWMMGDVHSVYAKSTTALSKIETEDTGVVILKFKNEALGVIEATTATRPKDIEGSLSILGEKGTVEIGGFAVNEIRHWEFVEKTQDDHEVKDKFLSNPPNVYGFGHLAYLEGVVESILNNKPALVEGRNGKKSLELITAIYESIESGQEILMDDFKPSKCRLGKK